LLLGSYRAGHTLQTDKGEVEVNITKVDATRLIGKAISTNLEGFVTNRTVVDIDYLKFERVYLDQDGKQLKFCDSLMNSERVCSIRVEQHIPRNGSVALATPAMFSGQIAQCRRVRRPPALYLVSWTCGTRLRTSSRRRSKNCLNSPCYSVEAAAGIGFELSNQSELPIEILWDQSSFIDIDSQSSRIVHTDVRFVDKDRPQPNTVLPPRRVSTTLRHSWMEFSEYRRRSFWVY
jgi:hypothetical protein